jgi:hypothetical protein
MPEAYHEEQFPRRRLNGREGGKRTIAGRLTMAFVRRKRLSAEVQSNPLSATSADRYLEDTTRLRGFGIMRQAISSACNSDRRASR